MEYIPSEKFTKRTTGAWYFPGAKVIKIRFVLKSEFIPFFLGSNTTTAVCFFWFCIQLHFSKNKIIFYIYI